MQIDFNRTMIVTAAAFTAMLTASALMNAQPPQGQGRGGQHITPADGLPSSP